MKTNLMDVHVHPEAANEPNPTLYKRPSPAYSLQMPGGMGAPGRIDMWSADQMTGAFLAGARVSERLRMLLDQRPSLASGIEAWTKWHVRVSETEAGAAAAVRERVDGCGCETCTPQGDGFAVSMRMILCATCGNKRCPHATDHRNACTNSNEPGQKGSSWEHIPPWPTSESVTMGEPATAAPGTASMREALVWCAAALQGIVPEASQQGRVRMLDTQEQKTVGEILDMANAALAQPVKQEAAGEAPALEPTITLAYVPDEHGTFRATMTISGLPTEEKAQRALDHMERLFCGAEIGPAQ